MRFVMISDVHGKYKKMIEALVNVNFDKNKDTLVTVGDLFDRGEHSLEVLEFIMSCPNRILLWGNHDMRLKRLLCGAAPSKTDYYNGVLETFQSFCGISNLRMIPVGISLLKSDATLFNVYRLLWDYFDECVFAAEWDDLIATHAWIPCVERYINEKSYYLYKEDWRASNRDEWYEATWSNSFELLKNKVLPSKKLLIGHWHTFHFYEKIRGIQDNFDIFEDENIVAIDGCSNYKDGKVNVYIYENDSNPILIQPQEKLSNAAEIVD